MPKDAKELVDKLLGQRETQKRSSRPGPHPDEISLLQVDAQLALAKSNVELVEALKAFAGTADKHSGALNNAIVELTAKVAALRTR
ncbi:hypothetical protein [Streptomyces nigra]|uniref:hypothetical protein n=1 Tax=Streptomyces nigra TaxID=1827580 RepID=UPI00364521F4